MYVKVRVRAQSRKEEVKKINEKHFEISVKEKAKQNLANKRVMEIVSKEFKVLIGKVRIVSGHHSPSKILSVDIED